MRFGTRDFSRLTIRAQRSRHNNVMHAKPDLRVLLEWMIARSGSVIADVELNRIAAGDWLASLLLSLGFVRAEFDLLSSFAIV